MYMDFYARMPVHTIQYIIHQVESAEMIAHQSLMIVFSRQEVISLHVPFMTVCAKKLQSKSAYWKLDCAWLCFCRALRIRSVSQWRIGLSRRCAHILRILWPRRMQVKARMSKVWTGSGQRRHSCMRSYSFLCRV